MIYVLHPSIHRNRVTLWSRQSWQVRQRVGDRVRDDVQGGGPGDAENAAVQVLGARDASGAAPHCGADGTVRLPSTSCQPQ